MALWGNTDANEAKPKWLTTEQKEDVIANQFGWVAKPGGKFTGNGNANASPEILCFIKGLSGKIGTGDISGIDWITTAFDKSEGGTLSARVHFNEAVTVTGNPKIVVSGTGGRNHNLPYVSGSGTSSLVFTSANIAGGASATNANDVLSFGANCMAQVSGSTIVDTSGTLERWTTLVTGGNGKNVRLKRSRRSRWKSQSGCMRSSRQRKFMSLVSQAMLSTRQMNYVN